MHLCENTSSTDFTNSRFSLCYLLGFACGTGHDNEDFSLSLICRWLVSVSQSRHTLFPTLVRNYIKNIGIFVNTPGFECEHYFVPLDFSRVHLLSDCK